MSSPDFWKSKLAAYLHDPPSKVLEIRTHRERSDLAFRQAGFVDDAEIGRYLATADHTAAAADRLPFPSSQASGLQCAFDGVKNCFRHPLSGEPLRFHAEFKSVEQGMEAEQTTQPSLDSESLSALSDESDQWRARFFSHWRLWPKHAAEKDYRLSLLPADTRIPDHTIWSHMQVVSALDGCSLNGELKPAFLKFQLGPVQEFIAAARSIRDLWSGSYLLSWLMAAGLKRLTEETGPDAVVFPNLRGQPLFDLHWRDSLWDKVHISQQNSIWNSLDWKNQDLLTPNLPNVFLAVVPAAQAADLARAVEKSIREEWKRLAEAVWLDCEERGLTADEGGITRATRRDRFDTQIASFLSLTWQVTPWPASLEESLELARPFAEETPVFRAKFGTEALVAMAQQQMPPKDRDKRFFADDAKTKLNNVGLAWSVLCAINSWQLDAVRQTRAFPAAKSGGWEVGTFNNKDSLTGREVAVAGGEEWTRRAQATGSRSYFPALFKKGDWLGAPTLVKRLWHRSYLEKHWGLDTTRAGFPMPNTRGIASGKPENDCSEDDTAESAPPHEKYFAVLAFDGDEIGKWVSGEKTPQFETQLADYTDGSNAVRFGAKCYFEKPEFTNFLTRNRPLSPSYHLQFSESLSNFALLCARPIVEAYSGRLIYAGGDDVVALLPADTALACAQALRDAFRGSPVNNPDGSLLFASPAPGFLDSPVRDEHGNGHRIPFVVPGSKADASVGIAIAHFKSPLQDVVREAHNAEKDAKGRLGRSAVSVTLMKRSGEIHQWGAQWDSGGLELHGAILRALREDVLTAKFPHRVVELVEPYSTTHHSNLGRTETAPSFTPEIADEVLLRELAVAVDRQRGPKYSTGMALISGLRQQAGNYLKKIPDTAGKVRALIGVCQAVAFAHRTTKD